MESGNFHFCFIYFLFSHVSKIFKRYYVIIISQLIIAIIHFLTGLTGNIILFSIMRLIIGYLLGIIVPVGLNILTEYLPIFNRAYVMVLVWIGFGIGRCLLPLLMLWMMPNMEIANYPYTIMVSSSFSFISYLCKVL